MKIFKTLMNISESWDNDQKRFVYVCEGIKPSELFREMVFQQYSERVGKIEHVRDRHGCGTVGYSRQPVYIKF